MFLISLGSRSKFNCNYFTYRCARDTVQPPLSLHISFFIDSSPLLSMVSYDVMSVMSVVFFLRRSYCFVQAVLYYIRRREVSYDVMSVVQVVM